MGYYSDFEIHVEGISDEENLGRIAAILEGISGYTFSTYGDGVLHSDYRFKWYDHERDMAELSLLYRNRRFEVRITGEDSEMVQVFAVNGKVYRNYITPVWPEFDESQLPA